MRFATSEVARATGGTLSGSDADVDGAAIDSRAIRGGELFVAVVGDRDGHEFVGDAVSAGAVAYLSSRGVVDDRATAVLVDDTAAALAALGRAGRDRLPDRVVGITGSNGKTSTKDLLGSILGCRLVTAVSERSFNNELGVPLTLVNAPDGAQTAVVEMGARGFGHIEWLCGVARPTVGIVTNVGPAHTEKFGSADGVARAKGELVEALPASGAAVLNAEDARVSAMAARTSARVVAFGSGGDVVAEDVRLDDQLRAAFRLRSPWGTAVVRLSARGRHQVANALAAAAAALVLGIDLDAVVEGLAHAALSPWRMQLERTGTGALVLNDAYNANPASVEAALRALVALDARRRIAVLGPMLELGPSSDDEHRRIGQLARELGVDVVLSVGAPQYGTDDVTDIDAALDAVGPLGAGDAVLVKASRAAGLERLAAALAGEGRAWSPS